MNRGLLVTPLLLALVACGSNEGSEETEATEAATSAATASPTAADTPTASVDEAQAIREAAQAYSDAYLTGDADAAYALLSERCQARMSSTEFAALVSAAELAYGDALPFTSFDAKVNGDQARVTYTFTKSEINQTEEPWAKEDGSWREDDC